MTLRKLKMCDDYSDMKYLEEKGNKEKNGREARI